MVTTTDERPAVTVPQDEAESLAGPPTAAVQFPRALAAPAERPAASHRTGPSFDQYLVSQIPLALAMALIFGIVAFAAVRAMPASGTGGGTAAAAGTGGGAAITAFSGGPAAQVVQVAADPAGALKWDQATYEAQAGDVTFVVTNKSVSTHNFAVEGGNVKVQSPNFGSNTTNSYTIKGLPAGEYQIVCNFPGHKEAGMVARLIVR